MTPFAFARATDINQALQLSAGGKFLAGGTNLIDLMREGVEQPSAVMDLLRLPLNEIEELPDGGLRIGATVRNSHLAAHPIVRKHYRLLSDAILNGASAQLRNMATTGGNLMQRTRCYYFYDTASRCNKRSPGAGCDAMQGFNRIHAILGASSQCIATHPSDMCVALAALNATVNITGLGGDRVIPFTEFHRLPEDTPHLETNLQPGELITSVDLPGTSRDLSCIYRKVRDRASYAFALVAVAAAVKITDGTIADVRLALGGVAHKPWRATLAEEVLRGSAVSGETFARAAQAELQRAVPHRDNGFKIELARRIIIDVLTELTGGEVR